MEEREPARKRLKHSPENKRKLGEGATAGKGAEGPRVSDARQKLTLSTTACHALFQTPVRIFPSAGPRYPDRVPWRGGNLTSVGPGEGEASEEACCKDRTRTVVARGETEGSFTFSELEEKC